MLFTHFRRSTTLVLGLFLTITMGCASSPSRFYSLSPLENHRPAASDASAAAYTIVSLGPVIIPDYMKKPQIVTRSGRNEHVVNKFRRWSGALEDDFSRVLIQNLSSSLPDDLFRVVNWVPSVQNYLQIAYRVTIDVMRIELSPVGPVSLRTQWTVVNVHSPDHVTVQESYIDEPVVEHDFSGMVDAFSRTLVTLSLEIAKAIVDHHSSVSKMSRSPDLNSEKD